MKRCYRPSDVGGGHSWTEYSGAEEYAAIIRACTAVRELSHLKEEEWLFQEVKINAEHTTQYDNDLERYLNTSQYIRWLRPKPRKPEPFVHRDRKFVMRSLAIQQSIEATNSEFPALFAWSSHDGNIENIIRLAQELLTFSKEKSP